MSCPGATLKAERIELCVSLEVLSEISGVAVSALSRWERDLGRPSDAAVRAVLTALTCLQSVRMRYAGVPLDMSAITWLRQQIAALNNGADAKSIAASGEAAE